MFNTRLISRIMILNVKRFNVNPPLASKWIIEPQWCLRTRCRLRVKMVVRFLDISFVNDAKILQYKFNKIIDKIARV